MLNWGYTAISLMHIGALQWYLYNYIIQSLDIFHPVYKECSFRKLFLFLHSYTRVSKLHVILCYIYHKCQWVPIQLVEFILFVLSKPLDVAITSGIVIFLLLKGHLTPQNVWFQIQFLQLCSRGIHLVVVIKCGRTVD